MCPTIFTSFTVFVLDKLNMIKNRGAIVVADPYPFLAGSVAGAAARAAVLPVDKGAMGPAMAVYRRAPQWGILYWVYVPMASTALEQRHRPQEKLTAVFLIGMISGIMMRVLSNPFTAVRERVTPEKNFSVVAQQLLKDKGVLGFYNQQHPIMANGFHYGLMFTFFEAIRNFADNHGAPMDNVVTNAACNTVIGTVAAASASIISFPYSSMRYQGTLARESAVTRSLTAAVLKEAPQAGIAFGIFSLLMPFLAPHHGPRCGFGH